MIAKGFLDFESYLHISCSQYRFCFYLSREKEENLERQREVYSDFVVIIQVCVTRDVFEESKSLVTHVVRAVIP